MVEVVYIVANAETKKMTKPLIWANFSSDEVDKELDSTNAIKKFTAFFLCVGTIWEHQSEMLLKYLIKINNEFNSIINDQLATELKLIVDFRTFDASNFNVEHQSQIEIELKKITTSLNTYIENKKNKLNNELRQRFESFNFLDDCSVQSCFQDFPTDEAWRFYVDGRYQKIPGEKGWVEFEKREPGCLQEMHKAFKKSLDRTDKLSLEVIHEIHQDAIGKVNNIKTNHKKIRGMDQVGYDMIEFSILGLDELQKSEASQWRSGTTNGSYEYTDRKKYFSQNVETYRTLYIQYRPFDNVKINEMTQAIINGYYVDLSNAKNKFEIFMAIIKLCSSLIRLHPFNDGNGRVFINILLNTELLKNQFPCVILENPNLFDNLSQDELADEVLTGMKNFEYVKKNKIYPDALPFITTQNINAYLKSKSEEYLINVIPNGFEELTAADTQISNLT